MPISVLCPGCKSRLTSPDTAAGKVIQCPKCQTAMRVPSPGPASPAFEVVDEPTPGAKKPAARADRGAGEDERPRKRQRPDDDPPRGSRRTEDEDDRPRGRRRVEDDEDEDDRPRGRRRPADDADDRPRGRRRPADDGDDRPRGRRRPRARTGSNKGVVIGVAAAVGGVVLIGVGVVVWNLVSGMLAFGGEWPQPIMPGGFNAPPDQVVTLHIIGVVDDATSEAIGDELGEIAPNTGRASSRKGTRMTVMIAPVPNVEEFVKKITFGDVHSVRGNVIAVSGRKLDGPPTEPVARALQLLKSKTWTKRREATGLLSRTPPDPARREEVARALEQMLADPPANDLDIILRGGTLEALGSWGTAESVPVLVKDIPSPRYGYTAVKALGNLKNPRGIDPVAECLEKGTHMFQAKDALIAFGPAAEDRVLKILDSPNGQARSSACEILEKIGTARSLPALEKATTDKDASVKHRAGNAIEAIRKR